MTGGEWAALLIAAAAVALIVAPLLRRDAAEAERLLSAASAAQELQSRREMLMASLKDLEDDRATGKVDDADYEELKAKLSRQAVDVMKAMDEIERQRPGPAVARGPVPLRRRP